MVSSTLCVHVNIFEPPFWLPKTWNPWSLQEKIIPNRHFQFSSKWSSLSIISHPSYILEQNKQDILNQNRLLPTSKNLSVSGKAITCCRFQVGDWVVVRLVLLDRERNFQIWITEEPTLLYSLKVIIYYSRLDSYVLTTIIFYVHV